MNTWWSLVRYIWAAPTTAIGLLVMLAGLWRVRARVVDGVLEAHGPALAWLLWHFTVMPGGAAAMTLGHVVIARDRHSLESTRSHERVHVRQCEVWGPLFVPAYLAASLWALLRGRHFYFDNCFEVEAAAVELESTFAAAIIRATTTRLQDYGPHARRPPRPVRNCVAARQRRDGRGLQGS